jgi:hypothetical protein
MTEAEWLACGDVAQIVKKAGGQPNGRKIRLLICAWCRRIWDILDERHQEAVDVGERYADGLATAVDLEAARTTARLARKKRYGVPLAYSRTIQYTDTLGAAANLMNYPQDCKNADRALVSVAEKSAQLTLLRDIFGNPFRPISIEPSWRTSTVVALATGIYHDRAFDRMPILADALQDAGCENDDILNHCRGEHVHVRGCWVVDLILGRE